MGGLLIGLVVGLISGLVGIGGGGLMIPALIGFYGMSQHKAQGTSLATMLLPVGVFACWKYWQAGEIDVKLALLMGAGFALGGWLGGSWAQHLPEVVLRRSFAGLLLVISLRMMFR